MSGVERDKIEAWLGADHALSEDQVVELLREAEAIWLRYPQGDERKLRDAALRAAYRVKVEDPAEVVAELGIERARARDAEARAVAGLRQVATTLIRQGGRGIESQQGFATAAGVSRSTLVKSWLDETYRSTGWRAGGRHPRGDED